MFSLFHCSHFSQTLLSTSRNSSAAHRETIVGKNENILSFFITFGTSRTPCPLKLKVSFALVLVFRVNLLSWSFQMCARFSFIVSRESLSNSLQIDILLSSQLSYFTSPADDVWHGNERKIVKMWFFIFFSTENSWWSHNFEFVFCTVFDRRRVHILRTDLFLSRKEMKFSRFSEEKSKQFFEGAKMTSRGRFARIIKVNNFLEI